MTSRRGMSLIVCGAVMLGTAATEAGHIVAGVTYPRVRTHSGAYYGPTQAHFEYFRRYGRPWHGQGGFVTATNVGFGSSLPWSFGYPSYGYGGFAAPGFFGGNCLGGFGYGYTALVSPWSSYAGFWTGPSYGFGAWPAPFATTWGAPGLSPGAWDALQQHAAIEELKQGVPEAVFPPPAVDVDVEPTLSAASPSSEMAQLRSLRHQQHGDQLLTQLEYYQAYLRYRDAISAAPERPEPHLHMAIALAGMKDFDKAARELKQGLALDPDWPQTGRSLVEILGEQNIVGRIQLKQRVAEWTLQDVRDADRLFLLGTLLHLDGEREKAGLLLETAEQLVGLRDHLAAFSGRSPASGGVADDVPAAPIPGPSPWDAMPRPQSGGPLPPLPGSGPAFPTPVE